MLLLKRNICNKNEGQKRLTNNLTVPTSLFYKKTLSYLGLKFTLETIIVLHFKCRFSFLDE